MMLPRKAVPLWQLTLLTIAYFVAGKLGLMLAFVHAGATAVWPPTGIAFAAFLLLGSRVWPAILLGAFLVNVTTEGSVAASIGIATGNTLEGFLGASLVARLANGRRVFDRARDVFKFLVLAGLFSTTLSATVGVASLSLGGYTRWADFGSIWFTWWLGNAAGDLVVAPVLVLWSVDPRVRMTRTRALECAGLLVSVILVGRVVFSGLTDQSLTFLCIPPLVWSAFRFGQRGTASAIAILSAIAIWETLRGVGPFVGETPHESLLLLQVFMGVMATLTISMAAVVSERKREEEALARLVAIVSSSRDSIASMTLDAVITSWNEAAEHLYGYSAGEAVGQPLSIIIPPELPNELSEIFDRLKRGERLEQYETVRLRKDGARTQVSITVSPILDSAGAVIGVSGIARDINARKRLEAALRRSQGRAEAFLEAASEGIVIIDANGRIVSVNRKTEQLFGYDRTELVGQGLEILLPERLRAAHVQHRARYFAEPRVRPMGRGLDLVAQRKDGTEFPVEISLSFIVTEEGTQALGSITDITNRKRVEEAARRAEAFRSVALLANASAHEINNPLTAIMGYLQLLADKMEAAPATLASLRLALEAGERIHEVVTRMQHITALHGADDPPNLPEMLDLRKSSDGPADSHPELE